MADRQRLAWLRPTAIAALAVAVTALFAAGCGGSDKKAANNSTTSTSSSRLTPAAFATKVKYLARGDAICRQFRNRRSALLPELNRAAKAKDAAGLAGVLTRIAAYSDKSYRDFKALPKPKGDEATLDVYLALEQQLTNTLHRAAAAYKRGNVRAGTAIIDAQPTLPDRARKVATSYGFKICGSA